MAEDKKSSIEPIRETFDKVVSAIAPRVAKAPPAELVSGDNSELVEYSRQGESNPVVFRLDPRSESIWVSQAQIAELFETDQLGISRQLKNIFDEGELDTESNMQKVYSAGSANPVTIYSLDTIISVGYRVNSKAVTWFRQWATQTIKAFIEEGYVLNDPALLESPEKLIALAAKLRALRSEEK
ncbi:MAG: RhuM family protein [Pseudomonadota bacterium]